MRLPPGIVRVLPAVAAIALGVPAAIAAGGTHPRGTALLPDLDQEAPAGLVVTRGVRHGHRIWRLGFRSAARNVGSGPLIIDGRRPDPGQRRMAADQVLVNADGPRTEIHHAGHLRYVTSPDHQHWHLLGFDRYELRRPGSAVAAVRDRKTGFCLGDRYRITTPVLPARAPQPLYTSRCGLDRPGLLGVREGISVGYGDDYSANLEGQYLPLDGLRAGRYVLVHRVNASRRLAESSYANNAASALLRLRRRGGVPRIRVLAVCPDAPRCTRG